MTPADLGPILRGADELTGAEYQRALDELRDDGYLVVHEDTLASIAAAGPDDGTNARRLALVALLASDLDLLSEVLVDLHWRDQIEVAA